MRLALLLTVASSWPAVGMAQATVPAPDADIAQPDPDATLQPGPDVTPEPDVTPQPEPDADTPQPEPDPQDPPADDPRGDGDGRGSPETAALGTLTFVGLALTVAGAAIVLERANTVDVCEAFEAEDPRTRGCVNLGSIRDERDVSVGIAVGAGALTLGAGIAWLIVALAQSGDEEPEPETLRCVPGPGTLDCALRF